MSASDSQQSTTVRRKWNRILIPAGIGIGVAGLFVSAFSLTAGASRSTAVTTPVNNLKTLIISTFKVDDANHDNKISLSELAGTYSRDYKVMDLNHDGKVSQADVTLSSTAKLKPAPTFKSSWGMADANHDGTLSLSEYSAYENHLFAPLVSVVKSKGTVTLAQVEAFYQLNKVSLPQNQAVKTTKPKTKAKIKLTSAFYDYTSQTLVEVGFDCGAFCGTSWTNVGVGNSNSVSDPGDGGEWCAVYSGQPVSVSYASNGMIYTEMSTTGTSGYNVGICMSSVGDHDAVEINDGYSTPGDCFEGLTSYYYGGACTMLDYTSGNTNSSFGPLPGFSG